MLFGGTIRRWLDGGSLLVVWVIKLALEAHFDNNSLCSIEPGEPDRGVV
jgi:hypothetical protein